jgi:hypothetical protein
MRIQKRDSIWYNRTEGNIKYRYDQKAAIKWEKYARRVRNIESREPSFKEFMDSIKGTDMWNNIGEEILNNQ